ncbi:MAG: SDR family oxidoreductase [Actinomycetota bacterium]|jgi:3-oxoacyl-[acyl-carrier protein] reductase|nr:SDR family oxidoreductase [Actinomycetota bacterium]
MTENVPTYPDLAGKVAVVTGGSGGIGSATCRLLAANGARVAVHGRDEDRIGAVVDEVGSDGGKAIGIAADVTDFAAIERMRLRVEEELGPVEVLAAFAASGGPLPGPTVEITEEGWRSAIDGNLTSAFLTLKSFLPGMIERGSGSIVTMASSAGRVPTRAPTAYAAAKAGVVMLSRQVADEVGGHGVRVNCLAPDSILTERTRSYMTEDQVRQWAEAFPLGRMGAPEDVALATLFLASESSSWLTGVTLDVAGGKVML